MTADVEGAAAGSAGYRTAGDSCRPATVCARRRSSSERTDARDRNKYSHFATEQFEQDRGTTIVGDALQHTLRFRKNPVDQPDAASRTDARRQAQPDKAVGTFTRPDSR